MNKNYFSDITDLFLKVKQEENIKIDESAKANIKQMLQTKISEMKGADTPAEDTYNDLELLEPKRSFWSTWKNQLVSVPASLAAIAVVVYAATNLNVSIPKEDFSPTRDTQTNVPQAEVIEEEAVEEAPKEFDRPLVKTAPGLLVLDFSETENDDRSLNKVPTKTIIPVKKPQIKPETNEPVFVAPEIEYSDSATFVLDEPEPTKEVEPDVIPDPEPGTAVVEDPATKPTKEVEKTENPEAVEIVPEPAVPIDSLDADIPHEEPLVEEAIKTGGGEIIKDNSAVFDTKITEMAAFPLYVYQDETLKTQPAFTEEKLAKLTRSKTPDSVTVYYVEDNQVVVEIEEDGIIKWYLFDNINDTWTISRYKKFITDNVVR